MSEYQSITHKSFLKGINAAVDRYSQPTGTIPRASNLLLSKRGSLITCDGSQIIHAFNGLPTAGRGRILSTFLFAPTGVASYYMMLANAPDIPLGMPQNLSLATAAGGNLAAATYFYKVTAIDGIGGETAASAEASIATGASGKNTLTWNVVPNAAGYNVYRSTSTTTETLLIGTDIPVAQVAPGTLTVTYVDTGADPNSLTVNVTSAAQLGIVTRVGNTFFYNATFVVNSTTGIPNGLIFTYVPGTNNAFAVTWQITSILSPTQFTALHAGPSVPNLAGATTTGGTFQAGVLAPGADTTQQIVLFKMPVIPGLTATLPVSYNNSNIVALFPANLKSLSTNLPAGGGGGGGIGGSGSGGNTGGGGGAGGGSGRLPISVA